METLAFIYAAAACETALPEHQLRSLKELGLHIAPSAGSVLAGATVLSVLTAAPEAQAVVQQGDICPAVRDVQTALQDRGYATGEIDGIFGGQTAYAVGRFQQRNGLPIDRRVDLATAQAMGLSGSVYASGARCSRVVSVGTTTNRPNPDPNSKVNAASSGSSALITVATNGSPLNVRSSPNSTAAVIATLPNGTVVNSSGRRSDGWLELERGGWVAATWVKNGRGGSAAVRSVGSSTSTPTITGSALRVTTQGSPLNIRSGPGISYEVIGVIANGSVINPSGRTSDGWTQLASGGWVASTWVGTRSATQVSNTTGRDGEVRSVTVDTSGNPLNARLGPGFGFGVAIVYPDGTSLTTTGRTEGDWIQLTNQLWVSSEWVN